MKKWLKWTLIILGVFVILKIFMALFGPSYEERIKEENAIINKLLDSNEYDKAISKLEKYRVGQEYYEIAQSKLDSVKTLQKNAEKRGLVTALEFLKSNLDKSSDFSNYYKNKESLFEVIKVFNARAIIINNGKESDVKEANLLANEIELLCSKIQIKEFPKLRKALADFIGQTLWEEDIQVKSIGSKNKIIDFVGGTYALNKNKKETQEALTQTFRMFRFDKANYKWSKRANEYTEYKMDNLDDKIVEVVK